MKRCPQCKRVETDEALKFCRVDGTTLVDDSSPIGSEAGTAQPGSTDASEVHTSILPHNTDYNVNRATGPTTAWPVTTGSLAKGSRRQPIVIAVVIVAVLATVTALIIGLYFSGRSTAAIDSIAVLPFENKSDEFRTDHRFKALLRKMNLPE